MLSMSIPSIPKFSPLPGKQPTYNPKHNGTMAWWEKSTHPMKKTEYTAAPPKENIIMRLGAILHITWEMLYQHFRCMFYSCVAGGPWHGFPDRNYLPFPQVAFNCNGGGERSILYPSFHQENHETTQEQSWSQSDPPTVSFSRMYIRKQLEEPILDLSYEGCILTQKVQKRAEQAALFTSLLLVSRQAQSPTKWCYLDEKEKSLISRTSAREEVGKDGNPSAL